MLESAKSWTPLLPSLQLLMKGCHYAAPQTLQREQNNFCCCSGSVHHADWPVSSSEWETHTTNKGDVKSKSYLLQKKQESTGARAAARGRRHLRAVDLTEWDLPAIDNHSKHTVPWKLWGKTQLEPLLLKNLNSTAVWPSKLMANSKPNILRKRTKWIIIIILVWFFWTAILFSMKNYTAPRDRQRFTSG